MSKPALGRGLDDLLQPARPVKTEPAPFSTTVGAKAEGGVVSLLRGKAGPVVPPPASGPSSQRAAGPNPVVVLSLIAADAGLALAGVVIARQNPFALAPWRFLFGIGLVGLGGWLGCLGLTLARDGERDETGPDQFFKR